jgi:flagellar biosynthesis/type III secretory pathway M-ring protein FliF/YscJ
MLKKLPFIIPLLALIAALIALLVWWFTPHYTAEEEATTGRSFA